MSEKLNIKGILINAEDGIVSEVIIKDYSDINKKLGVSTFTCVRLSKDEVLFVDDEGLINGTEKGFRVSYGDGWLAGNGLILGVTPSGDSVSTKLGFADIAKFGITHTLDLHTGASQPVQSVASYN